MRLEEFRPQLKAGRFIPQDDRLIYEVESPADQIVLPIELADFLFLCKGEFTFAEIIENIYRTRGFVQFKTIVTTLHKLKRYGFLVNGHELDDADSHQNRMSFFPLFKSYSIPVVKRIFNDRQFPVVFYSLAVLISVFGFISLSNLFSVAQTFRGFGSPLSAFFIFLFGVSFLLTVKGLVNTVLQMLISGRAYNVQLKTTGYAAFLAPSTDALFLINEPLYLWLYQAASALLPFAGAGILSFLFSDSDVMTLLFPVAALVTLLQSSPFETGDLLRSFHRVIGKESSLRLIATDESQPLATYAVTVADQKSSEKQKNFYIQYCLLWLFSAGGFASYLFYGMAWFWMRIGSFSGAEKLALLALSISICAFMGAVLFNGSKLILSVSGKLLRHAKDKSRIGSRGLKVLEHSQLHSVLSQLPLFSELSTELLSLIIQKSAVLEVPKGGVLIRQGQEGDELFVLLAGQLDVFKEAQPQQLVALSTIHPTTVFGEMAIVENARRSATVIAAAECVVFSIPAKVLHQIASESHYVRELDAFRSSILVSQYFASAPLFKDLNPKLVPILLQRGKIENYEKETDVFQQGDYGDSFYLLLRGTCTVLVNGKEVSQLHQGDFFGEISLIADIPRTGTIRTLTTTNLLKVNRETFWEILSKDIRLALIIEEVGRHRIWQDIEELKGKAAKIA